ncbi:MAG: hypothetical protein ACR2MM_03350 [Flavobacteriaceae bacterium]
MKHKIFKDYLRIEFSGQRMVGSEIEEARNMWLQVANLCKESGVHNILAHMNIEGRLPIDSAYKLAQSVEEIGFDRRYKLAVVATNIEVSQNIQLSETIFANMGYEVRTFKKVRLAKKWLLSIESIKIHRSK